MRAHRILVVDDDLHILEVLEMRLTAMGFAVECTQDPQRALRLLGDRGFDVALFDLRMEPVDGIALARAAHARQSRLPVLIMTAHGTIETAVQAIKDGAFDFITKPFVTEELSGKIGRALSARRWARDRSLLRSVGEMLASSGAMERVLDVVTQATMEATETERAALFLREGEGLVPRASAGASPAAAGDLAAVAESAIENGGALIVPAGEGRVTLAAPLLVDGVPVGALVVDNPGYVVPTDDDLELLALFASQAAIAIKNARELSRAESGALAVLGRVAGQVAHELNDPLGGLKLYAHLLRDRFARTADAEGVTLVEKADRAIDRLADLVADITAYGRPPALRCEPARLHEIVDACLTETAARIAERRVVLVRELDDAAGDMLLDVREMRRVVCALLLAAVDALDDGGVLTVRSRRVDTDGVELGIESTGRGTGDAGRARTLDPSDLGMAIARSVVDRHGGQLEVQSRPAGGSRVLVRLPIRRA